MTEYTSDQLKNIGARWLQRIKGREKSESHWREEAKDAENLYVARRGEGVTPPQFNILHSNVETIVPAIINSAPAPDIRARFGRLEDGPAANLAGVFERGVSVQVDDSRLQSEVELAALDAYVAGRGVVRVRFDADIDDWGEVSGERVFYDVVGWDDYRQGPAKRWRDVPWVAYKHEVSEAERRRIEDPEITQAQKDYPDPEEDLDADIWEVWCKETRKVYFVSGTSEAVLAIRDDPLGLQGFFPQGEPVVPIRATRDLTPVCPYSVYRTLAEELDRATARINKIMRGMKVRGLFTGAAEDLARLSTAEDNELVAGTNLEQLAALGGLDKAVLWWPIETAAAVIRELLAQREVTKQQIYEITGISDIVRGASKASETATAQQIKAEWGSLRVRRMQELIQRLCRDLVTITVEILAGQFTPQTLMRMSGVQLGPEELQMLQSPLDHYRIDIETDSTIRADLTKSRTEMSEFLRGTAEFFATMAPVVQSAPQAAGPLAKMYAAFAQQFSLGKSAEDALDQFVEMAEAAAQQPQGNPGAEAAQAEMQFKMRELEVRMQEAAMAAQGEREKLGLENRKLIADTVQTQVETEIKRIEVQLKAQELDQKAEKDRADTNLRVMEIRHGNDNPG